VTGGEPRGRALELLRQFGRDTVSFQGLESGCRYFFDGDDGMVAFVDTGGAWVGAGGPVAAPGRIAEVAERFADAATAQSRRACFFAAEQHLVDAGVPALLVGEQPVWRAAGWDEVLRSARSLRYQLARARHKGVAVRRIERAELQAGAPLRESLDQLGQRWQATHRLAPMQFLVQLEPLAYGDERLMFVAEHAGSPVGLASAVPVYARGRMFLEDLVRSPSAPNGTSELLVDAVMRAAPHEVTLGLAPLAGEVARWLRLARWVGGALYDFQGLRAFKAKLRPHAWEPVYLCARYPRVIALRDSLRAFAGGGFVGFAKRSMFRSRS
jgi:phosphatidylglycerol lysyltransferase